MKKKKIDLNKKLFLDKETISDLSKVNGGGPASIDTNTVATMNNCSQDPLCQSAQTCIFQSDIQNGACGPCTNPTLPPRQTQDYPGTLICQTGIEDCGF